MEKKIKYTLIILLILFISTLLRIYNLSTESLWKDEALAMLTSGKQTIYELIVNLISVHQTHPPLYFLILHYWGYLFGFSEFSMRFISVIFGVGIVFMIFIVSKELFDRRTAIVAMLLSTFSTTNLIYAQEAKQYSMLGFFVLLSTYFLIKMIKDKKFMSLYFLSSIFMFYTHHIGLLFFFMQTLFLILFEMKLFFSKKFIFLEIICFLLYSPLLFMITWAFLKTQNEVVFLMHTRNFPFLIAELGYLNLLWPAIILGLIFLLLYFKFKKTINLCNFYSAIEKYIKINLKRNRLLFCLMFLPILLYILSGIFININFLHPYFVTKYPFFLLPFIHIFISRFLIISFSKRTLPIIVTILLLISSLMIFNFYFTTVKSDWASATEIIKKNIKDEDFIIYPGGDNIAPFLYYFPNTPFNYSDIKYEIYDYTSMEKYDENKMRIPYTPKNETLFLIKDKMKERKGGVWVIYYYRYNLRGYFDEFANKNLKLKYKKNFDKNDRLIVKYYILE